MYPVPGFYFSAAMSELSSLIFLCNFSGLSVFLHFPRGVLYDYISCDVTSWTPHVVSHPCPFICFNLSNNKATVAAVISRLRISNSGELKEI